MRSVPVAVIAATVVLLTLFGGACTTTGSADVDAAHDDVVHVHELLVRDDGTALVATHTGLFRVTDDGLERVGSRRHDLMAATLDGDTVLASGHPELGDETLRVEDLPPLLGLVASDDGETWTPRSLLGEADFHGLVQHADGLFAANSSSEGVWVSDDGGATWKSRAGEVQLVAFAVDPGDASHMIGADLERGLVRSDDGGDSWTDLSGPGLVDLEWTADGVFGHDEDGVVHRYDGDGWTRIDGVDRVAALGARGSELHAFVLPATVLRSVDAGETWDEVP